MEIAEKLKFHRQDAKEFSPGKFGVLVDFGDFALTQDFFSVLFRRDVKNRGFGKTFSFNPDFAIETQHRDGKEGCRFGRKKMRAYSRVCEQFFSDEDAALFAGECRFLLQIPGLRCLGACFV